MTSTQSWAPASMTRRQKYDPCRGVGNFWNITQCRVLRQNYVNIYLVVGPPLRPTPTSPHHTHKTTSPPLSSLSRLLSHISCLKSHVSRLSSPISRLSSPVSPPLFTPRPLKHQ